MIFKRFHTRSIPGVFKRIFYWILKEVATVGYLSPEAVFMDGTHIKANANIKKKVKKAIPEAAKACEKRVFADAKEKYGMRYTLYRG